MVEKNAAAAAAAAVKNLKMQKSYQNPRMQLKDCFKNGKRSFSQLAILSNTKKMVSMTGSE